MGIWELLLLAVGVSMDAFAVSVCKGLAVKKVTLKEELTWTLVRRISGPDACHWFLPGHSVCRSN